MLTYATAPDYLLELGKRFGPIGRSLLSFEALAKPDAYPVLLVEGDTQGQDLYRDASPAGVEQFTFAVQVLTQAVGTATTEQVAQLLRDTKGWADALCQQLRHEHPGVLAGVNKQALPANADSALATGWRVELTLKLYNDIDRAASAALFDPAP